MIAVGDIHGKLDYVQAIIRKFRHDRILWIGDWFDSFHHDADTQIACLEVAMKRRHDIFLLGNHDAHYVRQAQWLRGAGFNHHGQAEKVGEFMRSALPRFRVMHMDDGVLFSHGGVTQRFFDAFRGMRLLAIYDLVEECNESIHDLGTWKASNPIFHIGKMRSGNSDSPGPLWCDWRELLADPIHGFDYQEQVVGHSRSACNRAFGSIVLPSGITSHSKRLWCIDCLDVAREVLRVDGGPKFTVENF